MQRGRVGLAALLALAPGAGFGQEDAARRMVEVARAAVVAEVRGATPARFADRTPPQPVFVTIEVGGVVRGCRGDLIARARSLPEEVALAARAAAAHDPRYRPLAASELARFLVTVTVVARTEPLASVAGLPPEDGIVLRSGGRTGIVLPWEGRDPAVRLDWAYRKAGVTRGTPVSLERLVAQRFRG